MPMPDEFNWTIDNWQLIPVPSFPVPPSFTEDLQHGLGLGLVDLGQGLGH
jgi:hypothetical protein